MKIVIIGTVRFTQAAVASLLEDAGSPGRIVAVVTQPPGTTHFNSDYVDLLPLCDGACVPVIHTRSTRDPDTVSAIAEVGADVILVLGWSQLLDSRILGLPRLGCIGTHPAPLPRGRGRHPLIWTMVSGEPEGWLSFFHLEATPDTGPVYLQSRFPLEENDHAEEAYAKMCGVGSRDVRRLVRGLADGSLSPRIQDAAAATVFRRRNRDDGILRWQEQARVCHALIRALARPYVGALAERGDGRTFSCWRVAPLDAGRPCAGVEPGTVCPAMLLDLKWPVPIAPC